MGDNLYGIKFMMMGSTLGGDGVITNLPRHSRDRFHPHIFLISGGKYRFPLLEEFQM